MHHQHSAQDAEYQRIQALGKGDVRKHPIKFDRRDDQEQSPLSGSRARALSLSFSAAGACMNKCLMQRNGNIHWSH